MSTPPLEDKIKKGFAHHGKEISKGLGHVEEEVKKTSQGVVLGMGNIQSGDLPKASMEAGMAIGEGIVGVTKATAETGLAVGKTAVAALTFPYRRRRSILDYFWRSRRGIITGAADNDPAGVVTYLQTGAAGGYNLLWLAPFALPLLIAIEEMSARIGLITRKGINQIILENFGSFLAWIITLIILLCNTVTIGADIAAMADVSRLLLSHIILIPSIILAILIGAFFIYSMFRNSYSKISRCLFILTPIFLLYVISAFLLKIDWDQAVRHTFYPMISQINGNLALLAVGFLGTTITPFLIFWETTQEIEQKQPSENLKKERKGVITGMIYTQLITFFIMVSAAAVFLGNNHLLTTPHDAALALKPFGYLAFLLFSVGIIGSGLIAVPVLSATTAYTFCDTLNWKKGLNKSFSHAKGFYWVIFLSIIIGILITLSGVNTTLMLFYSQVLNGVLMPILLVVLLIISNSKKILGGFTNKFWSNLLGILTVVVNIVFVVLMFMGKMRI